MNRLLGPSEAGQRLMAALLGEMEEFMPLGWRKLPRSVVRWLFQDAPGAVSGVPDMLRVPPAAWWSGRWRPRCGPPTPIPGCSGRWSRSRTPCCASSAGTC